MKPILTAFERSPDRGRGLGRDMPVRWTLEELGLAYDVRLVTFAQLKEPAHRARNPFGQIPTFEQDGLALFESGAIVLHLAQAHPGLLPADPDARARAVAWMFAAVSTVEPPIMELSMLKVLDRDKPWYEARLPVAEAAVRQRLAELSRRLGDADWLEGAFSAADLLLANVLRRLKTSGLLDEFANVAAYVARGEARPAFQRAFAAQRAVFEQGG